MKEAKTQRNNLQQLHDLVLLEALKIKPKKMLLVIQKEVEQELIRLRLPENVITAHHNAVAGRDEFKTVSMLMVAGRTAPPPTAVEQLAEALTGAHVPPLQGWYPAADAVREVAGELVACDADRHPDPLCEAIRWQICEGELLQIIGRGRGVNRGPEDPLTVLVLTDPPLPVPLAETISAFDVKLSPQEQMLLAGGVVFESPADAATAYKDLWNSYEAAKKAFQRKRKGTNSNKPLLLGACPAPLVSRKLTYQRQGAGHKPAVAWVYPALVQDPRGWLQQRLGQLVAFEIEDAPQLQPAAPEQPEQEGLAPCLMLPLVPHVAAVRLPAGLVVHAPGVSTIVPAQLWWLGEDPPAQDLQPLPPLGKAVALVQVDAMPHPGQVDLLRELAGRLDAVKPPRMWNDFTDAVRLMYWRDRQAKARAKWWSEPDAAEASGGS